jgi:predicted nucleic acid-binding protein
MLNGACMAEIKSQTHIVCDAGPIIHLDELGCLHLLEDFEKVVVPEVVRREVLKHRKAIFDNLEVNWIDISKQYPIAEPLLTMSRVFSLDAGETSALSFMARESGFIFLTDDAAARMVATRLGHKVHGTIGVLIRAIRRSQMRSEEVIKKLTQIQSHSTLHIKYSLLEEIIARVKKEYIL